MKNSISFKVFGRYAMFTDPATKTGGEKCSYPVPTYEALKGICKSIYWSPAIIWIVDRVRVVHSVCTHPKGIRPMPWHSGTGLSICTYLYRVEYQVEAHFEFNLLQEAFLDDHVSGKHFDLALKALKLGGRRDVFLGTRECQAYVEPCDFDLGVGFYDGAGEMDFGTMFHGFDYPDETGLTQLSGRWWDVMMYDGVITFPRPEQCDNKRFIREYFPTVLMPSPRVKDTLK